MLERKQTARPVGVATAGDVTTDTQRVRGSGFEVFGSAKTHFLVSVVDVVDLATLAQLRGLLERVVLAFVIAVVPGVGGCMLCGRGSGGGGGVLVYR